MKHLHLIFILLVIAGLLLTALSWEGEAENRGQEFSVELRDDGFYPRELTVRNGDTVTFKNVSDAEVWPASDPHPTHDYLEGFDPEKPLSPGDEWRYTFNAPGNWPFHDHLHVSKRGEIIVLGKNAVANAKAQISEEYCSENDGKCFDTLIKEVVHTEGIDAAYDLFRETYAAGKLPRTCHWTAHQIGEAAYDLFREGKEFSISYATSFCGYGFYHGFLEGLLRENPDVGYALSFCSDVEKQLGKLGLWNCYHGIGHGFTEDPPDPRVWGNFDAMLAPGIKTCEYLFGRTFSDLNLCLTGVYTVPAGFAEKGEYGLRIDPEDPFAFCRTQPYRYHKACYGEFTPKLDSLPNWSLSKLPKILETVKDDRTTRLVVWVTPSVMMSRDILKDDHTAFLYGCRENFSGRLKNICLGGTILGFFSHGEPEKQYLKALTFCGSSALTEDERYLCYGELGHRMRQEYSEEKMREACTRVPSAYQRYCEDTSYAPAYDDPSFD